MGRHNFIADFNPDVEQLALEHQDFLFDNEQTVIKHTKRKRQHEEEIELG